jgi:hypothetical protein
MKGAKKRSLTGQFGQAKLVSLAVSVLLIWPSRSPLLPAPCSGAAYPTVYGESQVRCKVCRVVVGFWARVSPAFPSGYLVLDFFKKLAPRELVLLSLCENP